MPLFAQAANYRLVKWLFHVFFTCTLIFWANCVPQPAQPSISTTTTPLPHETSTSAKYSPTSSVSPTTTPTTTPTLTPTPMPCGPYNFAENINPLTGLPAANPEDLKIYAPALVSITNFPVTARPQLGLSYATFIYEMYIGEGASRFLAVFYGNYPPEQVSPDMSPAELGPVRSGRLPYETLRRFFNGFMVIASASSRVLPSLDEYTIVSNPNLENINGARLSVKELKQIAADTRKRLGDPILTGQRFEPSPPANGKPAHKVWVAFHSGDQIFWQYDSLRQAYLRYQDKGTGTPLESFYDGLNHETLTIENLIILYTNYYRYDETLFDIELKYIYRYPALLFRDGQMYEIYWTTRSEEVERQTGKLRPIRLITYDGKPFPLKPGQTWVEILQLNNPYYETTDSTEYNALIRSRQPGSGFWAAPFISPPFIKLPEED